MVSLIASGGQGRFRPHANAGYEWWSNGVSVVSDAGGTVTARNQMQFAAGFEFEAAPKATLLLDVLGGQVFGGGKLAFQPDATPAAGATASSSLVALPEGIARVGLAPGLKVESQGQDAAVTQRAGLVEERWPSRARYADGRHRFDVLGNVASHNVCAQSAADRTPARDTGFFGCTGSPLQTEGTVTVTQTTSTTTTTAIPALSAGVLGTTANRCGHRIGNRVLVPVRHAAIRRCSPVHRGVEFRRWRGRGGHVAAHAFAAPGNFTAVGNRHRQQRQSAQADAAGRRSQRHRALDRKLLGHRAQAREHRHRAGRGRR